MCACCFSSSNTGAAGDEAIVAAQARVAAAELSAKPLRGVDTKLQASDAEAARFYEDRLPYGDSDVAAQLGALAKKNNVRLSRASYVHNLPADGVTELRIDASVTGEYRSLAQFINGLERDRSFFLVENLALSGAQNGLVNLQMRIGTYIREPMLDHHQHAGAERRPAMKIGAEDRKKLIAAGSFGVLAIGYLVYTLVGTGGSDAPHATASTVIHNSGGCAGTQHQPGRHLAQHESSSASILRCIRKACC